MSGDSTWNPSSKWDGIRTHTKMKPKWFKIDQIFSYISDIYWFMGVIYIGVFKRYLKYTV